MAFFFTSSLNKDREETFVFDQSTQAVEQNAAPKVAPDGKDLIPQATTRLVPKVVHASPEPDRLLASCNALFAAWNVAPLAEDVSSRGFDFDKVFNLRGFKLARLAGDFAALSAFNVPLLVPLPADKGGGYLAVLGQETKELWSVAPAHQGRDSLTAEELNSLGVQMALVPWVDFASIGYIAAPGSEGENVRRLQYLLGLAGCDDVSTSGRFDPSSIRCVKDFQRQHGLIVDGLVGPRTLILLYQRAGIYRMPSL